MKITRGSEVEGAGKAELLDAAGEALAFALAVTLALLAEVEPASVFSELHAITLPSSRLVASRANNILTDVITDFLQRKANRRNFGLTRYLVLRIAASVWKTTFGLRSFAS
ncbi:MAG TPA: hypothetical protein VN643_08540 [Pyrinomonadaceae bacterium]|nr:hypothetical protein [Pyrinomonadaceae bacterium]